MKLALGAIQDALANPAAFRARADAGNGGSFGYTYANALRNAIYRYHRTMNRDDAAEYLEATIRNSARLKSDKRRLETVEQMDWYIDQHAALGWPTFDTRVRVRISVPARASESLICTGEVGRIDLVPSGGYAAWLFVSSLNSEWKNELRLPLLQSTLAGHTLGVPNDEIQVGAYDFENRQVVRTSYADSVIRAARRRFSRLVADLGF